MIQFRPHHFLCTLGFQGKGYSPEFVHNYQEIVSLLSSSTEEETLIEVTSQTDDICKACPHQRGHLCTDQAKITALDKRHATALSLKEGDVMSWKEAKKRIAHSISLEKFQEICQGCQWQDLGYCRDSLKKLHQKFSL